MPMFSVEEYELPDIEEALYQGTFEEYEETVADFGDGEPKDQFILKFAIPEVPDYLFRFYVTKFGIIRPGSKAKLAKVLVALNGGEELPVGWQGDLDDFKGNRVTLDIVLAKSKKGKDYWKINEVRKPAGRKPVRASLAKVAAPATSETDDDLPFD